jgi:hypothetical protein
VRAFLLPDEAVDFLRRCDFLSFEERIEVR